MTLIYLDRVQETTMTSSTGPYLLNGATAGYQPFSAVGDGNTCYYTATDGVSWEVGLGTYTSSGNTLSRTSVVASSNANAAVNWGVGTKTIWLDFPAAVATYLAGGTTGSGPVVLGQSNPTITLGNATGLPLSTGVTGRLQLANLGAGTSGYALIGNGSSDPSYQGYLQSGTGAATRTWNAKASDIVSPKDFGALGDGKAVAVTASITSSTPNLTAAGAAFTAADVNKIIVVPGAGAAGVPLVTTISAVVTGTQITLAANAATTLTAASTTIYYGTNDTVAFTNVVAYVTGLQSGGSVYIPRGIYFTNVELSWSARQGTMYGDGKYVSIVIPLTNFMTVNTSSYVHPSFVMYGLTFWSPLPGTKYALAYSGNVGLSHEGESSLSVTRCSFSGIDDTTCFQVPVILIQGSGIIVSFNEFRGASLSSYALMQKGISFATGESFECIGNTVYYAQYGIWAANGTQHEGARVIGNDVSYNDIGIYFVGSAFSAATIITDNVVQSNITCINVTSSGAGTANYPVIANNICWRASGAGTWNAVYVDGVGCMIEGNTVFYGGISSSYVATLDGATYSLVRGNTSAIPVPQVLEINGASHNTIEQYDDNAFYLSSGAAGGSARGVVNAEQFTILASDWTGVDSTNAQNVFPSGQATLALPASSTYEFEAVYYITRAAGTNSHTTRTLFASTGTLASFDYLVNASNGTGNSLSAVSQRWQFDTTAIDVTGANTSSTENLMIRLRGTIRTTTAVTITPQFQYGTSNPGGAPSIRRGTFFRCWPIGNNVVITSGNWS